MNTHIKLDGAANDQGEHVYCYHQDVGFCTEPPTLVARRLYSDFKIKDYKDHRGLFGDSHHGITIEEISPPVGINVTGTIEELIPLIQKLNIKDGIHKIGLLRNKKMLLEEVRTNLASALFRELPYLGGGYSRKRIIDAQMTYLDECNYPNLEEPNRFSRSLPVLELLPAFDIPNNTSKEIEKFLKERIRQLKE